MLCKRFETLAFENLNIIMFSDASPNRPLMSSQPDDTLDSNSPDAFSGTRSLQVMTDFSLRVTDITQVHGATDRRASVEHLRAVGQTFVGGLSVLRDRVSTATVPTAEPIVQSDPRQIMGDTSVVNMPAATCKEPQQQMEQSQKPPLPADSQLSSPSSSSSPPLSPTFLQQEVDRLKNILFATERKLEARTEECTDLRTTINRLSVRHERDARQMESLRCEVVAAREATDVERERAERSLADTARLRTELVDVERELTRQIAETDGACRKLAVQQQKTAALERVVMGLRRRVAVADSNIDAAKRAENAIAARHAAESALVEARTQVERLRARTAAVDALRDRAISAERAERELRDKVSVLEREIDSKDAVVRQSLAERRKLNEFMARYEKQLEEKEGKMIKLQRQLRQLQSTTRGKLRSHLDDNQPLPNVNDSDVSSPRLNPWDDIISGEQRAPSDHSADSGVSLWPIPRFSTRFVHLLWKTNLSK